MIAPRAFNRISVSDGTLCKTSDADPLKWESRWYACMPSDISRFVPQIYSAESNRI